MANKKVFKTGTPVAKADTVNKAGGVAYKRSSQEALAQYAVTGTFGNTFYASGREQLDEMLQLAKECTPVFLAKLAVYARHSAFMKDTPALLVALLSVRDVNLFKKVFPKVITNGRMLRNFVQIMRSGVVGRRSLGTAPKKQIRKLLDSWSDARVFDASVGNDPSLADIIKMVHPNPTSMTRDALYAYLIGRDYDPKQLPEIVQAYENYKKDKRSGVPDVNFQLLTSLNLTTTAWTKIFRDAKWHFTRMNLNTALRHGVLDDKSMVKMIAERIANADEIRRAKVFPYQLMAAYRHADPKVPVKVKNSLQDAMEVAVENVPSIDGKVVVAVDCSGSMGQSVTGGHQWGATSVVSCNDVASLVASTVLRRNEDARVFRFDTSATELHLNPRDSVMTNAEKIGRHGGGTSCSCVLAKLNAENAKADLVIIVSDNESWADRSYWRATTSVAEEWKKFKRRNKNARLIVHDIVAGDNTQARTDKDVLNVGGFSDKVFDVYSAFAQGGLSGGVWVDTINSVEI